MFLNRCLESSNKPAAIIASALLLATTALADTLQVPGDFATIQDAIDAATAGDQILVAPGVYPENIDFLGKSITVESSHGPQTTIIDGGGASSVVLFISGEGPSSVIRGFTLRNGGSGFASPCFADGGGVCIESSSPTVEDNIIVDNTACAGSGVSVNFGSPMIRGNTISRNHQAGCSGGTGGGGIGVVGAGFTKIIGNIISENSTGSSGGGISLFAAGDPVIDGNVIHANSGREGGGIWMVNRSDALVTNNLIIENNAQEGGGVYWLVPSGAVGPRLLNNTIADNDSGQGSGVLADGFDVGAQLSNNIVVAPNGQTAILCGDFNDQNAPQFAFNDVFSPSGLAYDGICGVPTGTNGNVSVDPQFRDATADDYRVLVGSPVIDQGDNGALGLPAEDIEGKPRVVDGDGDAIAVVDMGAYETALLLCNVDLSLHQGSLGLDFDLATTEPVSWGTWLFVLNTVIPLWSLDLPVIAPPISFDLSWNGFPQVGQIAIVSAFSTPDKGLVCLDIDQINTGGIASNEESIRHLLLSRSPNGRSSPNR